MWGGFLGNIGKFGANVGQGIGQGASQFANQTGSIFKRFGAMQQAAKETGIPPLMQMLRPQRPTEADIGGGMSFTSGGGDTGAGANFNTSMPTRTPDPMQQGWRQRLPPLMRMFTPRR